MIRKYKYTVFTMLFTVLFVFGSRIVMNAIWELRETRLLTESGMAEVKSPVRAWESPQNVDENGEKMGEDADGRHCLLSMEQMETAIERWNNRTRVILHEPVAGQISMEEAITAGRKWLVEMDIGDEKDVAGYTVNAQLGVGEQTEDNKNKEQLEAYDSFWTVQYLGQSISATLYLNAVTGKVWEAKITLYEGFSEKIPYERLRMFVNLAGLQPADDAFAVADAGESGIGIAIKDSQLHAREAIYEMIKAYGNELSDNDSYRSISYRFGL